MYVVERFELPSELRQHLKRLPVQMGFNGLGEASFYRSYSRPIRDAAGNPIGQEDWADVICRVIEGTLSIHKDATIRRQGLKWDEGYWSERAWPMAEMAHALKWGPPGRGYWMNGTEYMYERGSAALMNCAYVDVRGQHALSHDMGWITDLLMLGVGVGFSAQTRGDLQLTRPNGKAVTWQIPDTREGWAESVERLLRSYEEGSNPVIFDYSLLRPFGTPIRGFGGVASGPEPLIKLHDRMTSFCERYLAHQDGRDPDYTETRLIADLGNAIGACVVAGNVRRSAEIMLGNLDDPHFVDLKNAERYPERQPWMHLSNNCLPEGTIIHTERGGIPIEQVRVGDRVVTPAGRAPVFKIAATGLRQTIKIEHPMGAIECTPDHRVAILDTPWTWSFKRADEIVAGDALVWDPSGYEGQPTQLPTGIPYRAREHNGRVMCVPELTPEIAWFIGLLQGDGSASVQYNKQGDPIGGYVGIACSYRYPDVKKRVEASLSQFGIPVKVRQQKSAWGGCEVLAVNSLELALYVKARIKESRTCLHVPEWIRNGTREVRGAYLAGLLDSDGSATKKTLVLTSSVFVPFLEELRSLSASLGLALRLTTTNRRRGNSRPVHFLHLYGAENRTVFDSTIALWSSKYREQRPGPTTCGNRAFAYPTDMIKRVFGGAISYAPGGHQTVNRLQPILKLQPPVVLPLLVDQVVASGRDVATYDLEVENIHQFTAEGIVVHNSVRLYDDEDFARLPEIASRIQRNGEPGFLNMINIEKYGRFGDEVGAEVIPGIILKRDLATGANPCSEIPLESYECCCLSEVFLPNCQNDEEIRQAIEFATIYATTVQWLPTHRPETNAINTRNRRIGVSLSGIFDWYEREGMSRLVRTLRDGYKQVRAVNARLAREVGFSPGVRVTTVKPSGTISKMAGVSSGIHAPEYGYYIRRIRIARDWTGRSVLDAAGIPSEPDVTDPEGTVIYEFPLAPAHQWPVRTVSEVSMWEQLLLLMAVQRHWADNMVSMTVKYKPEDEGQHLERAMAMMAGNIKSASFMAIFDPETKVLIDASGAERVLYTREAVADAEALCREHPEYRIVKKVAYPQLPEEPITREEFETRIAAIKPFDWSGFVSNDGGIGEKYCGADGCEIDLTAIREAAIPFRR